MDARPDPTPADEQKQQQPAENPTPPMTVSPAAAVLPGPVVESSRPKPSSRTVEHSTIVEVSEHYAESPYPPPHLLREYNEAVPKLANRLIEMLERETAHRHELEVKQAEAEIQDCKDGREIERRGQRFGFLIGTIAIVVGGIVSIWGNPWAGGFIGTSGVAGLVSVFVAGRVGRPRTEDAGGNRQEPTTTT